MNFILDIDGTLWDTTEVVARAWNDAVEAVGLGPELGRFITADMLKKEFGKPMDVIIDDLFPSQNEQMQETVLEKIKEYEQNAVRNTTEDLTFPGVTETISKLVKKHRLFIVSNCQEGYIELVMNKLGIEDYIDDFESFGNTGLSKAENIRLVMNRNRFADNTAFYVGDTAGDYQASTEAGVPFIFASYGFGEMADDYTGITISAFEDLLNIEP